MYPIVMATARNETDGANETLRRYARWEYGPGSADWLLAAARGLPVAAGRRRPAKDPRPSLRTRFRYWINSFRGFAAIDVRGVDDPTRP
ncbi:MAG: hypothetical protein ACT4OI_09245 [Methanobacteriota archaeon]